MKRLTEELEREVFITNWRMHSMFLSLFFLYMRICKRKKERNTEYILWLVINTPLSYSSIKRFIDNDQITRGKQLTLT